MSFEPVFQTTVNYTVLFSLTCVEVFAGAGLADFQEAKDLTP